MCYHKSVKATAKEIADAMLAPFPQADQFQPIYHGNGFAHPKWPVLAKGEIRLMNWGLMPNWPTKSLSEMLKLAKGNLNARNNTIFDKVSFKNSIWSSDPEKVKRCVIPATGIFEPHTHEGVKYPFYIYPTNQPLFKIAGIYSHWKDNAADQWYSTYSAVTTDANRIAKKIHNEQDRMVVILKEEYVDLWLDSTTPRDVIEEIMHPCADEHLGAYSISRDLFFPKANSNRPDIFEYVPYEALKYDDELYYGFNLK